MVQTGFGGTILKKAVVIILLAAAFAACAAAAAAVSDEQYWMGEATRLNRELYATRLGQIAMVVDRASDGKERLMVGSGVSAGPTVGHVVTMAVWGAIPFITVYPVSAPVHAKLGELGEGHIIGAIALGVAAAGPKDSEMKAERGVYLLFWKTAGPIKTDEGGPPYDSLVAVSVNDRGEVIYREVARGTFTSQKAETIPPGPPRVFVKFPDKDTVSTEHHAWQVEVQMKWQGERHGFYLNLDIIAV